MNTTLLTWVAVAAVVGGALLLLLGVSADEQTAPLVLENIPVESAEPVETQYWQPVAGSPTMVQPIAVNSQMAQPCGTCGPAQPALAPYSHRVPSPCTPAPCSSLPTYCGTPCVRACPLNNPGINRNMDQCVDECTFVQLHTTIPHPICSNIRFEWSASKGSFLDPTASDPVFYVPTTRFPSGEDVWVVVTISDGSGAQYTDQLKLHVVNIP